MKSNEFLSKNINILAFFRRFCYNKAMQENCIVSISTPIGKGAIAIVRMSGKNCHKIAGKIFSCREKNLQPRMMYLGKLKLEENVFEQCFMVKFDAPYSYTGEDMVEFQIHGGVLLAQKVVEKCIESGARLAEPGEFSKRAFLNGKITLDKAEAITGEINAESEGELKSSLRLTNGKLAQEIEKTQEKLTNLLAELEVGMDYPDETEEGKLKTDVFSVLKNIEENISKMIEDFESTRYLHSGINVALVGRTNVGKSSVMNALLGQERAIVTDIQGTTRDQITESFSFKGIKINLVDTAGIRETKDYVESLGIEKSKQSLKTADLVLFVVDGSEKMTAQDKEISKLLKGKKHLVVVNKSDKPRKLEKQAGEIEVSALLNQNIEKLKEKILKTVVEKEIDFNSIVLTNERQSQVLKEAQKLLQNIISEKQPTLDILTAQSKQVWQVLGKITGKTENEDIINLIFSKFCLGK